MSEIRIKTELEAARDQRTSNCVSVGKWDLKTGEICLFIPSDMVHGSTVHFYLKHAIGTIGKYSISVDRLTCSIIEHEKIHEILRRDFGIEVSMGPISHIVEELRDLDEYKPRLVKK